MKNLYRLTAALITTSILFTSCSSDFSIMKRHYTNGYYIDYTKNTKEVVPKSIVNNTARIATTTGANAAQAPVLQPAQSANSAQPGREKKTTVSANTIKALPKTLSQVFTKPSQLIRNGNTTAFTKESTSSVSQPNALTSITQDGDRGEHAALSLLWLVIVIVLILWLIGILAGGFGLGGLINLLLVVALILLILWLLRII